MCWFCPWFWMCLCGGERDEAARRQQRYNYALRVENEKLRQQLINRGG